MAELTPWTSAQSRAQLAAVAWLRWRIFVHSFRYTGKKRGAGKWIVIAIARIVVWGILAVFCVGPIVASGAVAYLAVAHHHLSILNTLTWTVFTVSLFISINISPATIGFDLTPLLRFPIDFRRYLLVRLFFGLFAIPTVVANLAFAAAAVSIGIARPELFPWAALVLGIFALHNVFFIRMVFAWVDRWMATRRAREVFGGVVLFLSLGFQFLVVSGRRGHRGEHLAALMRMLAPLHPLVQYLPPGLAAGAIVDRTHSAFGPAYAGLGGLIAFALAFLAILAIRLKKEFRGENLSEAGKRAPRSESRPRPAISQPSTTLIATSASVPNIGLRLPPTIAACLQKELIYLKRSGAQLYGLITPLFFIFFLARTKALGNSAMLFPNAVTYMMFGLLANLYNVLGSDGPGFNLYLLAPVRLRDVLLAKNLVHTGVIVIEVLLATVAVSLIAGSLPPAAMLSATLLWACFALFVNLTVGNLCSLLAPMRFELGKARRAPMAKGGAFISLGVLFATLGAGIPILFACRHYGHLWLATPIFLMLDAAALFAYLTVLGRVDSIASDHREDITEALCKTS
jgi:ABC-2 type transport system permease protein